MKIEQVNEGDVALTTATVPGIATVRRLLDRWHTDELRYCHWKSNEHVDASVMGLTDLDILVDPIEDAKLQASLAECGFRRFQPSALTAYPGVEDYLAFDEESGRLVHLHLHHRLTLGQKHLKGYRLPWEGRVLDTRVLDAKHGIYTSSTDMELLLHLVRDGLKRRLRTSLRRALKPTTKTDDFRREYDWLVSKADLETVLELSSGLLGEKASLGVQRLIEGNLAEADRAAFAKLVRVSLDQYRTVGRLTAGPLAFVREAFWVLGGLSKRYFHWALPLRRFSPRGGVVVALIGSDGAGKSTTCKRVMDTFSKKLDVSFIYFGSGDGPASILRAPLVLLRRFVQPNRKAPTSEGSGGKSGVKRSLRRAAKLVWATTLAFEKRGKLRKMVRARNRGLLVITDRFPQDQVKGFNDGPLLHDYAQSNSGLIRWLSAWESGIYAEAAQTPPDVVVKLLAPIETALGRRPEMARAEIERRLETVRSLTFSDEAEVIEISTDQPADHVSSQVCTAAWRRL